MAIPNEKLDKESLKNQRSSYQNVYPKIAMMEEAGKEFKEAHKRAIRRTCQLCDFITTDAYEMWTHLQNEHEETLTEEGEEEPIKINSEQKAEDTDDESDDDRTALEQNIKNEKDSQDEEKKKKKESRFGLFRASSKK